MDRFTCTPTSCEPESILHVEDSEMDAALMEMHIRGCCPEDTRLTRVATLEAARASLESETPDLVLLDLFLPDGRGLEAVRAIQAVAPDTPLVVVTGLADPDVGLEMVRHGAQDFLVKGEFDAAGVGRTIKYALSRHAVDTATRETRNRESLGVLAGGIAHDFNNKLGVILGHASIALKRPHDAEFVARHLERIVSSAEGAAGLAQQMLNFSGRGQFVVEPVDINEILNQNGRFLRATVPSAIHLDVDLGADLPAIDGDVTQLRQLLVNLILNAAQAIGDDGGTIRVATTSVTLEPGESGEGRPGGNFVALTIEDTGHGMSEDVQRRIFEPFFSTRGAGRGLGLSAVAGIVRGHKGHVEVTSTEGEGTRFRILLPHDAVVQAAPAPATQPRAAQPLADPGSRGASLTVLVAEDEPLLCSLLEEFLSAAGHKVTTAVDGGEAIRAWRRLHHEIDAVVLDISMPVVRGTEIFETIRSDVPDLPVVICSGYAAQDVIRIRDDRSAAFVPKPYRPMTVVRAVEELVTNRAAAAPLPTRRAS